jgi:hypothetical protein
VQLAQLHLHRSNARILDCVFVTLRLLFDPVQLHCFGDLVDGGPLAGVVVDCQLVDQFLALNSPAHFLDREDHVLHGQLFLRLGIARDLVPKRLGIAVQNQVVRIRRVSEIERKSLEVGWLGLLEPSQRKVRITHGA